MTKRQLPKYVYPNRDALWFRRRIGGVLDNHKMESTDPDSPDFHKEYAKLLEGKPQPSRVTRYTFNALVESYRASQRYTSKKIRTQRDYDKYLDWFLEIMGDKDPRGFLRMHAVAMRDQNADRPYFANYAVKVGRVLFEHAIDIGWKGEGTNPFKGVPLIRTKSDPREPWPRDMINAYRAAAPLGTRQRLVMELCLGTGQRIGDVREMKWSDIQDGWFRVRQNKTEKRLWVPITKALQEALDAAERRSVYILTNHGATGPWSHRGASDAVMKVRRKIGAGGKRYPIHAWRYNAACELFEAGCEDSLIGAVTGQGPAMVRHYTASIRQVTLALRAHNRRDQTGTEQKQKVHPMPGQSSPGTDGSA